MSIKQCKLSTMLSTKWELEIALSLRLLLSWYASKLCLSVIVPKFIYSYYKDYIFRLDFTCISNLEMSFIWVLVFAWCCVSRNFFKLSFPAYYNLNLPYVSENSCSGSKWLIRLVVYCYMSAVCVLVIKSTNLKYFNRQQLDFYDHLKHKMKTIFAFRLSS